MRVLRLCGYRRRVHRSTAARVSDRARLQSNEWFSARRRQSHRDGSARLLRPVDLLRLDRARSGARVLPPDEAVSRDDASQPLRDDSLTS